MLPLRSIQSSFTEKLICLWIIELGCAGAVVYCPSPGAQDVGNKTSLVTDGQTTVRLISCNRGCCPGSADGCCYRTTDDVVVYSVPICVCTVLFAITIGFVYRHVRTKRLNRANQARLQAGVDKPELNLSPDNPPSYSSCVVETVSSTTNLTVQDVDDVIEVIIHANAKDVEDDQPLSPPPVYDDVFKSGDEDQVAVISPRGHVSFVDHNLLPPSVCCHSGRDGCGRPGSHSPRLCHVTRQNDAPTDSCLNYCPSPRTPRLAHLKEDQTSSPSSCRSLRLCHVKVSDDPSINKCHCSLPGSMRRVKLTEDQGVNHCHDSRQGSVCHVKVTVDQGNDSSQDSHQASVCHVKVTDDQGNDSCQDSRQGSSGSLRMCRVKVNDDHISEDEYTIFSKNKIKDNSSHDSINKDHVPKHFYPVIHVTNVCDHVDRKSSHDTFERDDDKTSESDNESRLMTSSDDVKVDGCDYESCFVTSGDDVARTGVTNEACTDISCGR